MQYCKLKKQGPNHTVYQLGNGYYIIPTIAEYRLSYQAVVVHRTSLEPEKEFRYVERFERDTKTGDGNPSGSSDVKPWMRRAPLEIEAIAANLRYVWKKDKEIREAKLRMI